MKEEYDIIQHVVTFYSPGTFMAETTRKPICAWDVQTAKGMARSIKERYGATPYGFQFSTRGRKAGELDSKEIERSGTYFLGGKILTLSDIKKRCDPKDKILIFNMEGNGWDRVVQNDNSWGWTQPFRDGDTMIPFRRCVSGRVRITKRREKQIE